MQSDLVERLRAIMRLGRASIAARHRAIKLVCDKAANEIERLRALTNDAPVERLDEQQFVSKLSDALPVAYRKAGGIARIVRGPNGAATIRNIATLEAAAIFRAALTTAPTAPVDCVACEGKPSAENSPCAICGRIAPTAPVVPDRERPDYSNVDVGRSRGIDDPKPTPTDTADRREVVAVKRIETRKIWPLDEEGEPIWRIEINGYCADFDHEQAARNFASAIASLIAGPLPEGWVAVPVEPTEAMLATCRSEYSAPGGDLVSKSIWSAMIAALTSSDSPVVPDREDKPTIPAGMVVWHGGPKPADWSGEAVQFRSGKVMHAPIGAVWKLGWDHSYGIGDIIAYTPKPTPTDTADRVGFHSAGEG